MCIRDRASAIQLVPDLLQPQLLRHISNAVVDVVGAECVPPVSYTHLRAHETVLDLVCRLLLEKKKQRLTTLIDTRESVMIVN